MDINEFREALQIDRDDLDTEVAQQPGMFQRVSDQWALAMSRAAEAKKDQKAVHARLWIKIRAKLLDEKERVTDLLLTAHVDKHKSYLAVTTARIEAEKEAQEWLNLKESWQQRSYALKELVKLFGDSYFETDSASAGRSRSGKDEYEETRKKISRARREKLED